MNEHLQATAPLRALVRHLHGGRSLAANVVRLRWRRRKAPRQAALTAPAAPEEVVQ